MSKKMEAELKAAKDGYLLAWRARRAEGDSAFSLDLFGDELAKRKRYKEHKGLEAIHFYLVEKYHWFPQQVKALNNEDLKFLLAEEMSGWTWPEAVRGVGDSEIAVP